MRSSINRLFISAALISFVTTVPVHAQDALLEAPVSDGVEEGDPGADGGIVVTGSRISREGFSAPTPVTTLGAEEIQARAPSSVADVLTSIPSFRASGSPTTTGVNSRGAGKITADLRGLGITRTLVLVNGRRFVPSDTDGVVDLKLVPSLLISQVETVTGGASAAWGSDAVAGVVNFILKNKFDGIQGSIQSGISEEGDNQEIRASLAAGGTFMDGRLSISAGLDYIDNKGVGNQYTRGWGRKEVGLISNAAYATNGLPQYIIAEGVHPSNMTPGGLIVSGPLRGTAFNPDGTPYAFDFGTVFGSSMIGGGNVGNNLANATQLAAPYDATIAMAQASYEFSPSFELFAEANAAWSSSSGHSQQPRDAGNRVVSIDNAYLPGSVRDAMIANGLTTVTVGRMYNDSGPIEIASKKRTLRGVIGARGEISSSWRWDAYGQYGETRQTVTAGPNNRRVANFSLAADAVRNPATGEIVCRSTLTNPTNGCIPQNIFGDGNVVVDDFSFGTAYFNVKVKQTVAAANVSGDVFSTWAGPVSIAVGGEYRKEQAHAVSDPLSQVNTFQIGNQLPFDGSYDLWEVYGETVIPLLRDSALGKSLDLNGAIRRTDYSTSGKVTTWKIGGTYEPFADLRLRATRSRDIRAPNLADLFQAGGSSFVNVFDPILNQMVQVREFTQGNTTLMPEKADTFTAGFVYQPSFISGLAISVDYYDIKVDDAIGAISTPLAVERCNSGLTQFCSQVGYNPDGTIGYTIAQQQNLNGYETSGVDVEIRKDFSIGSGKLGVRLLGTYVDKLVTIDSAGAVDRAGKVSQFNRVDGVPHLTGNLDLTYTKDDFIANLQTRFVGKGKYETAFVEGSGAINTISDNSVPAYAYLSLSLTQGISIGNGRSFQIFGVINNLLDTDPPFIPAGSIGGTNETSTSGVFYDVIGRAFKIGARFAL